MDGRVSKDTETVAYPSTRATKHESKAHRPFARFILRIHGYDAASNVFWKVKDRPLFITEARQLTTIQNLARHECRKAKFLFSTDLATILGITPVGLGERRTSQVTEQQRLDAWFEDVLSHAQTADAGLPILEAYSYWRFKEVDAMDILRTEQDAAESSALAVNSSESQIESKDDEVNSEDISPFTSPTPERSDNPHTTIPAIISYTESNSHASEPNATSDIACHIWIQVLIPRTTSKNALVFRCRGRIAISEQAVMKKGLLAGHVRRALQQRGFHTPQLRMMFCAGKVRIAIGPDNNELERPVKSGRIWYQQSRRSNASEPAEPPSLDVYCYNADQVNAAKLAWNRVKQSLRTP